VCAVRLIVHIDGGSRGNPGPAGAGVVIHDDDGIAFLEAGYFLGRMTNNQAEYRGLLRALEAMSGLDPAEAVIHSDSELLVRQITGQYRVRSNDLKPLYDEAQHLLLGLESWQIKHVPRERNRRADQLANRAMSRKGDVIEIELPGDGKADLGPQPRATAAAPPTAPQLPKVVVRVTGASNPDACPAPCREGDEYVFDATVPAGICANAVHALLNTVLALQHAPLPDDGRDLPPMTVRCARADCNAVFEVRCQT